jgi:glycosyltransferase involved in cell wall biosynthesis
VSGPVEIYMAVSNRREFTRTALTLLRENTAWEHVSALTIYNDGSTDGAAEDAQELGATMPVPAFHFRPIYARGVGTIMNDFVAQAEAELFVKLDNDIAVPPGWLPPLIRTINRYPDIDLLGAEAGWTGSFPTRERTHAIKRVPHIGGVGIMRTSAFESRRPLSASMGRNAFSIWQHRHRVPAAFIRPDLALTQLDKIPEEPWATLSRRYIAEGWARPREPHEPCDAAWWQHVPKEVP